MPDSSTILLVDDEDAVQKLLTYPLERDGFRVVGARDGEEALRLAREEEPDVAVLDVSMPRLNGYEVTERLREDDRTRTLPVILLTARAQDSDVARGRAAGADAYITKPFSAQELRQRVEAMLEER